MRQEPRPFYLAPSLWTEIVIHVGPGPSKVQVGIERESEIEVCVVEPPSLQLESEPGDYMGNTFVLFVNGRILLHARMCLIADYFRLGIEPKNISQFVAHHPSMSYLCPIEAGLKKTKAK